MSFCLNVLQVISATSCELQSDFFQRLTQIFDQIIGVLDPYAESEEIIVKPLGIEILTLVVLSQKKDQATRDVKPSPQREGGPLAVDEG